MMRCWFRCPPGLLRGTSACGAAALLAACALSSPAGSPSVAASGRTGGSPAAPAVERIRAPEGALQPQVALDSRGTLHLVYLKGAPAACDVYYTRRAPGASGWARPIRVNHRPGSAVAVGTIRGAQIALGQGDRVHLVWNGSMGEHVRPAAAARSAPVWYTRATEAGDGFEPERNLLQRAAALDGGATVAADRAENVYVAFQAAPPTPSSGRPGEGRPGETGRRLWLARSRDSGRSWFPEVAVSPEGTGACPCCSVRALADGRGRLFLLFRGAASRTDRATLLLVSGDGGERFELRRLDPWMIDT